MVDTSKMSYYDKAQQEFEDLKIERGLAKRNLHVNYSDFTVQNEAQRNALNIIKSLANNVKTGELTPNLIIMGPVGVGKTLLASALFNDLFGTFSVACYKLIQIIREIKRTWKPGSEIDELTKIDWFCNRDLLIIDEVGIQFNTDTERLYIFDIIDGRYQQQRPTILISNQNTSDIKNCIGVQCYDRLREDGGKLITLNYKSMRERSHE